MALTQKQEAFCIAYIELGNASEAYRQVYSADNMKSETINKRASELLQHGNITGRLDELRKPAVEAAQVTLASHLDKLATLRDAAAGLNQFAAAISAEVNRGKVAGLYVERTEEVATGYVVNARPLNTEEWLAKHKPH